jgi:hypothetical protein
LIDQCVLCTPQESSPACERASALLGLTMAEAEEYAGGDEDVAAAEQEEDVDEVRCSRRGWAAVGLLLGGCGCSV